MTKRNDDWVSGHVLRCAALCCAVLCVLCLCSTVNIVHCCILVYTR